MTKVYIVTSGAYSDYHIVGVYSDFDQADRIADLIEGKYQTTDVETYEVDGDIDLFRVPVWRVWINAESHITVRSGDAWDYRSDRINEVRETSSTSDNTPTGWGVTVRASDDDHAMRIAVDLVEAYRAREEGL